MRTARFTMGALLVLAVTAGGQEKSVRPGINDPFRNPDLGKYLETFEGESREVFVQRERIVRACRLRPGLAVADVGAGTGLFTRLFARQVGKSGKVYAVDIAQRFLDHIARSCKEAGIANVATIRCDDTSSKLPVRSVDVVFVCDTYHHFEFPFRTLASIHQALRPGGQLIVIDFHRIPGKSRDWTLKHVRAGQEVVVKEIVSAGFKLTREETDLGLKENYFLRFVKEAKKGANAP